MATTTTNFGWDIPQSTDLVKDGATAIAALGQDIDTALVDLKGGTTGQILSKASGTDLDFTWGSSVTPALTLVKTQTIGTAVSSVTVSSAFSSTYDNYRITITGGTASATNEFYLTFGSATTNYKYFQLINAYSNTLLTFGNNAASNIQAFRTSVNTNNTYIDVFGPNLTKITAAIGASPASGQVHNVWGILDDTTAYTAFTLTMGAGTMTGGTIRVYGYQNS